MSHRLLLSTTLFFAVAFAMGADETYTLRRTPKLGEVNKMTMRAELTVTGGSAIFTSTYTETVKKIDADGTYTVEEALIDGTVKFKDTEMKAVATAPSVSKYRLSGEIVSYINEQGKSDMRPANLSVLKFPDKSLKVGESWVWESKGDSKLGTIGVRGIYTVVGEEIVGKTKCLKIKTSVTETEGQDPAAAEGTTWLDLAEYRPVKVVTKWTNMPMNGGAPVSGTVTLQRVES